MIVNGDAKALEWVVGTYLSKDKVAYQEIWDEIDQHSDNQRVFLLPDRLTAKKFVFRLMYGGSAYSYANDPDFTHVSTSEKFWQKVIDKFYEKYKGFAEWHKSLLREVEKTGRLTLPTGRVYEYEYKRNFRGELELPQTIIKNYPVQGLGADVMSIIRVSFSKRFQRTISKNDGIIINTVHDSLVCDVKESEVDKVAKIFFEVFEDFPLNFQRVFKIPFDLPLRVEVSIGNNMKELTEIKKSDIL